VPQQKISEAVREDAIEYAQRRAFFDPDATLDRAAGVLFDAAFDAVIALDNSQPLSRDMAEIAALLWNGWSPGDPVHLIPVRLEPLRLPVTDPNTWCGGEP
jgi:hypothetical protein